jgi:hypothetical protein
MTIYCAPTASGSEDGSSWDNAIGTIAGAVSAATAEEIWIKEGTFNFASNLILKDGCDMFGSFSSDLTGTDGTKEGRDLVNDITIIDGGDATLLFQLEDADLDGFHIRNANSAQGAIYGSGDTCNFTNCTFHSNVGTTYGGVGLLRDSGTHIFTNCVFTDNSAARGGAVAIRYDATVTFNNCIFGNDSSDENSSSIEGGAIYVSDSGHAILNNCTASDNTSPVGGFLFCTETGSTASLTNCRISNNSATDGGALEVNVGTITCVSCVFDNNISTDEGAVAKSVNSGSELIFTNCVMADNNGSDAIIKVLADTTATITNCIMWDNTGTNISSDGTETVTYSDIESEYAGTGNIDSDPLFAGSGDDPYNITAGSPCIDAGDGDEAPTLDILGNSRYDDPAVSNTGTGTPAYTDIGAYEYQGLGSTTVKSMLLFLY